MSLLIGCAAYGFREMATDDRAAAQAALGFRRVEIGLGEPFQRFLPGEATEADGRELRQRYAAHGLEARYAAVPCGFVGTRDDVAREVDRVTAALAVVAAAGASFAWLAPGAAAPQTVDGVAWARMVGALTACDAAAHGHGVTVGFETLGLMREAGGTLLHAPSLTTDRLSLRRLLDDLPARVGVLWDPANVKAAQPDEPRCLADVVAGRVLCCHLKDWVRSGDGWRAVPPGDGDLDLPALLAAAGCTDAEALVEHELPGDIVDGTRRGRDHLLALAHG